MYIPSNNRLSDPCLILRRPSNRCRALLGSFVRRTNKIRTSNTCSSKNTSWQDCLRLFGHINFTECIIFLKMAFPTCQVFGKYKNIPHCENHFIQTYRRIPDGRFVIQIPFDRSIEVLGESQSKVEKGFYSPEHKF